MAGTAHVGAKSDQMAGPPYDDFPFMPGMTRGTIPFSLWPGGLPVPVLDPDTGSAGPRTAAFSGSSPAKVIATYAGCTSLAAVGPAVDWFDDLHILPRGTIDFGNVITQKDEEYEIYNAFRSTDITITSIDKTAVDPGINLPDATTPLVIGHQGSALSSSSTSNDSGVGLGTLVKLQVEALENGRSSFNGDIIFTAASSGEVVRLAVSGSRIVFIPFEYEAPVKEVLAFLTDIIEALDGKEQRIALRKNPRQMFEVLYRLSENERRRMQALLMGWLPNTFGFPLWHEQERLTAGVSIGATTYQVQTTEEIDLRVGGMAVVYTDPNTFDVITISSMTATTITSSDPSLNAYPAGTKIMPLRTAQILRAVPGQRYANNLEEFSVTFEVTDNHTGALSDSTTPGVWSVYDSRVLFSDCNVISGQTVHEAFTPRIHVIANKTGNISVSSTWDRSKHVFQKGFTMRSRAEIISMRKLLQAIQGRTVSFWIPTAIEDLEVVAALSSGSDVMDINRIEYQRFIDNRLPKNLFRITFTDGTSLVREILSSADHPSDDDKERLTLDANWPADRPIDEIDRVEFYELVRFDTDQFELNYPRIGLAKMTAPVRQVFDDNV